jgi:hypothetical protein
LAPNWLVGHGYLLAEQLLYRYDTELLGIEFQVAAN